MSDRRTTKVRGEHDSPEEMTSLGRNFWKATEQVRRSYCKLLPKEAESEGDYLPSTLSAQRFFKPKDTIPQRKSIEEEARDVRAGR